MADILKGENTRPIKSEQISDQTASGVIVRLHFPDGKTLVVKRARRPEDDKPLEHEFAALLLLNTRGDTPNQIPHIFEELPTHDPTARYAFQMEDIPGKSLVEDGEPGIRFVDTLPTWKRVDALEQAAKGLEFANKMGVIHHDVQAANIMYDPIKMKGKVIDWVVSQRRNQTNQFIDVNAFCEVVRTALQGVGVEPGDVYPEKIGEWREDVREGKFTTPEEAWLAFRKAAIYFYAEENK